MTTFYSPRVRADEDVNDHVDVGAGVGDGLGRTTDPDMSSLPQTHVLSSNGLLDDESADHKLYSLVHQALTESPLIDG